MSNFMKLFQIWILNSTKKSKQTFWFCVTSPVTFSPKISWLHFCSKRIWEFSALFVNEFCNRRKLVFTPFQVSPKVYRANELSLGQRLREFEAQIVALNKTLKIWSWKKKSHFHSLNALHCSKTSKCDLKVNEVWLLFYFEVKPRKIRSYLFEVSSTSYWK